MARLRNAPSTQMVSRTAPAPRQALKEKTNTARPKAKIYEYEEDIGDLVKPARRSRSRAHHATYGEDEVVMAGALLQAETIPRNVESARSPTTDDSGKSDVTDQARIESKRRPPRMTRKAVQSEAQSTLLQDMKKRMQATSDKSGSSGTPTSQADTAPEQRGPPETKQCNDDTDEHLQLSLLSSSPPSAGKLSMDKDKRSSLTQPTSALKSRSTPSAETSILALKNFKRRPRQPSMLQMVQQRTASARPSAAHVSAHQDQSVYDVEDVEDDEEEFAPEAESTPVHLKKAKAPSSQHNKRASEARHSDSAAASRPRAARKRKSDEAALVSPALDFSKTKRAKSTAADPDNEIFVASGKVQQSSPQGKVTRQSQAQPEVQVMNSSPSSTLSSSPPSPIRNSFEDFDEVVPSTKEQHQQQRDFREPELDGTAGGGELNHSDGTMAEPASSSPVRSAAPPIQPGSTMAEPLTQASPAKRREQAKRKVKERPMTTATLQSLLPKRRKPLQPRHRKSEYDIDVESEEEEESDVHENVRGDSPASDEEIRVGSRSRRQTRIAAPSKGKRATTSKSKSRQSKTAAPPGRKSSAPPARKSSAPPAGRKKKQAGKTYGRDGLATMSDKENEDAGAFEDLDDDDPSALPDNSISMIEAAKSKELEEVRRKFAEVDEWDMEFESMSFEEGRSSSQEWR